MDANLTRLLSILADNYETTAAALRDFVAVATAGEEGPDATLPVVGTTAVERAQSLHPHLGKRQIEALSLVEEIGSGGAETGTLSRRMNYDQPNVYLTLQGLVKRGLIEKDASQHAHRYYLSPLLQA
jgi:hypothetical protein